MDFAIEPKNNLKKMKMWDLDKFIFSDLYLYIDALFFSDPWPIVRFDPSIVKVASFFKYL